MNDISTKPALRRLPLLMIIVAAIAGLFFLRDTLSFTALSHHAAQLIALRDAHYVLSALAFAAIYAVMVALSLPGATLATLTGGFLFGLFPGVLLNVAGASIGAVAVFLAVRAGIGADIARRLATGGGGAGRLLAMLDRNQWSALLSMRFLPVVPFFAANLLPAFAGVRLIPFAVTTALGIVPAALILTNIGAGLGDVIASGTTPDLSVLRTPRVIFGLIGLAVLAALPMAAKALRKEG